MVEASGHAIVVARRRRRRRRVQQLRGDVATPKPSCERSCGARRANGPALRSVVMGCAAALDEQRARRRCASRSLPTRRARRRRRGSRRDRDGARARQRAARPLRRARRSGTRALLRIQDGCDEHCTFCATTLARGANRSRPIDELVREATSARRASSGDRDHREFTSAPTAPTSGRRSAR